jgi:hypothetical protein
MGNSFAQGPLACREQYSDCRERRQCTRFAPAVMRDVHGNGGIGRMRERTAEDAPKKSRIGKLQLCSGPSIDLSSHIFNGRARSVPRAWV